MPDPDNVNRPVALPEAQSWLARHISIEQELQAQYQGLQDSIYKSQRLHLEDLLSSAMGRIAALEARLKSNRKHKQQIQHQLKAVKQELEDYSQELQNTNRELCAALKKGHLTSAEAQAQASFLLAQDIPVERVLARLLSAIYSCPVTSWEFLDQSTPVKPLKSFRASSADQFYSKPSHLSAKGKKVQAQCQELAARAMRLQMQYQEVAAQSKAMQAQFAELIAQRQTRVLA